MSLARATLPTGRPAALPGSAPYPGDVVARLENVEFTLPCDDPWLDDGEDAEHAYLDAADEAWDAQAEWMDFLALDSPAYDLKRAARDLYLHEWRAHLGAATYLDVGCGIGRMMMPLLDRGATVYGIDGDLRSLQRCAWYAARRPGRLDLYRTTPARLPDLPSVDVAIACEVLCYVPDLEAALKNIGERLKKGGALLLAMEAEYGWAASPDAPADAIQIALGGGRVDLPGDRWVRTVGRQELSDLLSDAGFDPIEVTPTHYVVDGPLEAVAPSSWSFEEVVAADHRARQHSVWGPLNRIWTATARRL